MTREEAMDILEEMEKELVTSYRQGIKNKEITAFRLAKEALQQDIVRCKECKHGIYEWSESNKNTKTCHCSLWENGRKQTDFCSYGERREDK